MSLWLGTVVTVALPHAHDAFGPIKDLLLAWGMVLAIALCGVVLAGGMLAGRRKLDAPYPAPWIWALLLPAIWIWIVPAETFAGPDRHAVEAVRLTALIASAGAAALLPGTAYRRAMLSVWVGIGWLQASIVLLQAAGLDPFLLWTGTRGTWRVYGTVGNPNLAAALIVPLFFLAQCPELVRRRHLRLASQAIMGLAVIATGSRAGTAVLALGLLSRLLITRGDRGSAPFLKEPGKLVAPLGVLAGGFVVGAIMGKGLGSVGGRWTFWRAAVQLIARRPVSGYGLGHFQATYPQGAAYLALPNGAPLTLPANAHNDWLEFAVELGVIPSLLILAIGLWAARTAWAQGRVPIALALGALVLQGAWDSSLHATPVALLFFLLLGSVPADSGRAGRWRRASVVGLAVAVTTASMVALSGSALLHDRVRGHLAAGSATWAAHVGEWEQATDLWREARGLAPGDGAFSYWLSQGLAGRGELDGALHEARRARTTYARFHLYLLHAQLEYHGGNEQEAIAVLRWILTGFPQYDAARTILTQYETEINSSASR